MFFLELIGGGSELWTDLLELLTEHSAIFCKLQNSVTFRFMIFAELYSRRTLDLFFYKGIVQEKFEFFSVRGYFFLFFFWFWRPQEL